MDPKAHWEQLYTDRDPEAVSWHQDHPTLSLTLIEAAGIGPGDPIIDVGGGAARLVDALLERGFGDVTVLDIAETALAQARRRLGPRASQVRWEVADVTRFEPPRRYALWHDRAVFHFLTAPEDRAHYRRALRDGLRPGGHAVIATFGPDGPTECSGLPVVRYSPGALKAELGADFELVTTHEETHITPRGKSQAFVGCLLRYTPEP